MEVALIPVVNKEVVQVGAILVVVKLVGQNIAVNMDVALTLAIASNLVQVVLGPTVIELVEHVQVAKTLAEKILAALLFLLQILVQL